ncbi:uncharacterized protein J3R85_003326 [Psidium guajava]|nr:uncharacterized protein J3R85_003326 [Psidium guajava]
MEAPQATCLDFVGGVTTKVEVKLTSKTKREMERAIEVQTRRTESRVEVRGWLLAIGREGEGALAGIGRVAQRRTETEVAVGAREGRGGGDKGDGVF